MSRTARLCSKHVGLAYAKKDAGCPDCLRERIAELRDGLSHLLAFVKECCDVAKMYDSRKKASVELAETVLADTTPQTTAGNRTE